MSKKYNANLTFELLANAQQFNSELRKARGSFDGFVKNINRAAGFLAGGFLVGEFAQVGRQIIDTRAEFQKFEAVLENTLGSNADALKTLDRIEKFAAETPFAIDQVTAAFVKLANTGFAPNNAQLRSLGDLASNAGKTFDQLAEAVIDAQVGEFERLREFFIRAKNQGDTVAFTFRNVTTEVENSSDAIRDYILSLGNAEGVSGAMEKISKTLGGQLSNLDDNFTTLRNNLGKLVDQEGGAALGFFNDLLGSLNQVVSNASDPFGGLLEGVESATDLENTFREISARAANLRSQLENQPGLFAGDGSNDPLADAQEQLAQFEAALAEINRRQNKINEEGLANFEASSQATVRSIQSINKEIDKLEKARLTAPREEALALSRQIQQLKQELQGFTQINTGASPEFSQQGNANINPLQPLGPALLSTEELANLPENGINPVTLAFSTLNDEINRSVEGIDIFASTLSTALANGASVFESFKRAAVASISEVIAALIKQAILSFVVTQILSPLGLFNAAGSVANIARGGQFGGLFGFGQFSNMSTNFSPVQVTGTLVGEGTSLKGVLRNVDRQDNRMN